MGSKGPSGNTTTTVQQQNPVANMQLPFLSDLYGSADWQMLNQNMAPLIQAQNYQQGQGDITNALAGGVMPSALQQYQNQIGMGIPSAGQAAQLTANAGNAVNTGLGFSQGLAGVANNALGQVPGWQQQFLGAGQQANQTLGGYGAGAINAFGGLAPGALTAGLPAEWGLNANAGAALGGNPAYSSGLGGLASGQYINPATNPAYAGMIQSATQPLVNQYMTATAPQVASQFEGAGRYGSGAQTNAQGQAQYGLGQALGNAVSGITNNAYNTGLQATLGAGSALGNIYNTGISNVTGALGTEGQLAQAGVQNAGNLLNQGYTTGGNLVGQGYSDLNAFMGNAASQGLGYLNAGMTGLQAGSNAAQAGYGTANTALTGAGGMLNQGDIALTNALSQAGTMAGYPVSQYMSAYNAPWQRLTNTANILGGAVGGTGTQTSTQPYYSNTGANILGGISGGLGIANTIGGTSGIFPGAIAAGLSKF